MFYPQSYSASNRSILEDDSGMPWTPLYWHPCSFPRDVFLKVMMNLIRNPNINSNHLFRADILMEAPYTPDFAPDPDTEPKLARFNRFQLDTAIVRRLIPRNALVDKPLDQTCLLYSGASGSEIKSLVIYLPHISKPSESPFYHPAVHGIAFLHSFNPQAKNGVISIHYSFFPSTPQNPFLERTAQHLLATLHKHGQGTAAGYVKRVEHDVILPQAAVQNTYARLKAKYARELIAAWVEVTDPTKHVFEDLGIAAFLIELWREIYPKGIEFPGFVDIGCGNGLLVHILIEEGYSGYGFDARRRKSWEFYSGKAQENLKELVLIPDILQKDENDVNEARSKRPIENQTAIPGIHSGNFPKGTFIISNHADELTPWTPILAHLSESLFLAIPCCSHNLTGSKFRAPTPKESGAASSTYASLVAWVSELAGKCGWEIEKEMLRIPSTRNTALLGRRKKIGHCDINIMKIIEEYGGARGWEENAMKLVKCGPRGH